MPDVEEWKRHLYSGTGFKPLNTVWAKFEIVFGLGAAGIGLLFMFQSSLVTNYRSGFDDVAGLLLFVLGSYLAMAGNRSHLYQSNVTMFAWLLKELAVDVAKKSKSGEGSQWRP